MQDPDQIKFKNRVNMIRIRNTCCKKIFKDSMIRIRNTCCKKVFKYTKLGYNLFHHLDQDSKSRSQSSAECRLAFLEPTIVSPLFNIFLHWRHGSRRGFQNSADGRLAFLDPTGATTRLVHIQSSSVLRAKEQIHVIPSSVSDTDPYWIYIQWPSVSGSLFRIKRLKITEELQSMGR